MASAPHRGYIPHCLKIHHVLVKGRSYCLALGQYCSNSDTGVAHDKHWLISLAYLVHLTFSRWILFCGHHKVQCLELSHKLFLRPTLLFCTWKSFFFKSHGHQSHVPLPIYPCILLPWSNFPSKYADVGIAPKADHVKNILLASVIMGIPEWKFNSVFLSSAHECVSRQTHCGSRWVFFIFNWLICL